MLLEIFTGHVFAGIYAFFLLGCGAAWIAGKSNAQVWRGLPMLLVYILILGVGLRFIHFALYNGAEYTNAAGEKMQLAAPMFSLAHYIPDTLVLIVIAWLGYQVKRTNQMTTQYHWLYEKASPLSWRNR